MSIKLTIRKMGEVAIVDASGRLTLDEGATLLPEKIWDLLERGYTRILLNMAGITYVDSCGLGRLAMAYTAITALGGEMKLLNLAEPVRALIEITKLSRVFETYENEALAVRSFSVANAFHVTTVVGPEYFFG